MVNQELLSYIRQQLSQKVAKDAIKTNLMSQGWLDHDIAEGFVVIEGSTTVPIGLWTKGIAKTNKVFMIISLILVFGVDLLILISSPSLAPYWYVMLGVFAVFLIFYYLENFVFRKRFAGTKSSLDKWIVTIIVIRNIVFLLNFIPLIQILGLALLGGFIDVIMGIFSSRGLGLSQGFGVIGLLSPVLVVIYVILVIRRYSTIKASN